MFFFFSVPHAATLKTIYLLFFVIESLRLFEILCKCENKMSEPELTAIFKLQFYRKQKNWVFNRKGDTRKKDAKKEKGEPRKGYRDRSRALNQTYTVSEAPSNLNEAFLETGPNAPGEDTADKKKIDPHQVPDTPWPEDKPADQSDVNINNNYTGDNKYPNLNLTQKLHETKESHTESLTLSKASISLNKLRHFDMEESAQDNKDSAEMAGDLAETCPIFGPIVQSLWVQYEASKGEHVKGWPMESEVWTNAEHSAMDYEDSDLGQPCGDSQDVTDGVDPLSYLDIPFLPPGLPLPPSMTFPPPGFMMHPPPAPRTQPHQDPRSQSHYDQPLSKKGENVKADFESTYNQAAVTYNQAQFIENQAQIPSSREYDTFMNYQRQSMTYNQARDLMIQQARLCPDKTTYDPAHVSYQNSTQQTFNNYTQDRRTSNQPLNSLNDNQAINKFNDTPWSPSKPNPAVNKPSQIPRSVSKTSLHSNLPSKSQTTLNSSPGVSATKSNASVMTVNPQDTMLGRRVSQAGTDWAAGVMDGVAVKVPGSKPVVNRELLKQHLDRLRLQDCFDRVADVAPDFAHKPSPNCPAYPHSTEAIYPPTIAYTRTSEYAQAPTTEYTRTSEYAQPSTIEYAKTSEYALPPLHESVSSTSVDSEEFMAGARQAAHSSEIELCDRVSTDPRDVVMHRPPSMQQYYDRQTPSFDELPTRDVGPTSPPTFGKHDLFLAGSFRDAAAFDGSAGRGRGRLLRAGGKWRA
ncbi:hypothetical protein JYU34_000863 [Plutella xylostella]|uniref:Uncharacterized protein n=1 Tax=Plutella xylostella TaxID=51655 RepID=A0ABQ7R5J5_PLUXY|nr:hypothetical protein JYU34_000863 [Plutella xylostella]